MATRAGVWKVGVVDTGAAGSLAIGPDAAVTIRPAADPPSSLRASRRLMCWQGVSEGAGGLLVDFILPTVQKRQVLLACAVEHYSCELYHNTYLPKSAVSRSGSQMAAPKTMKAITRIIVIARLFRLVSSSSVNCNKLLHCRQRRTLIACPRLICHMLKPGT